MLVLLQGVSGRNYQPNSKPFAGVAVADRGDEEAGAERQHENVHHEILLCVVWHRADGTAFPPLSRAEVPLAA
jgi:hypothetical protein